MRPLVAIALFVSLVLPSSVRADPQSARKLIIGGAMLTAGGAALTIAGTALVADGATHPPQPPVLLAILCIHPPDCDVYKPTNDRLIGGAVVLSVGVATLTVGSVLLAVGRRRARRLAAVLPTRF